MEFNEYQKLAQRTSSTKELFDKQLNAILGLNGEVGELTDLYKKAMFQGHNLDVDKVVDELSDILWYMSEMCDGIGVKFNYVADHNIEKLKKRYPNGFDVERSLNRKDD